MLRLFFSISLFLSAMLLFSIQPMVAKALLPVYGGTPAVWTVCMLFFQVVLLISYGYVWLLSFINNTLIWRLIHFVFVLFSLLALPLLFHPINTGIQPEWEILYNLLIQIGMPVLVLGASASLLQFAYSQTRGESANDPYFLYVASNIGSLLALLLYPWGIEFYTGLNQQFYLWSVVYFCYAGLLITVFLFVDYKSLKKSDSMETNWPWKDIFSWIGLSFIPCSLMMGVTLYISTDIAATPLFWVVPLALYLLSFIITFTSRPCITQEWISRSYMFFIIFIVTGFIFGANQLIAWQLILFNLSGFFVLAVLCQGQLFLKRPKPQLLTLFYFCIAIGGVLAGLFNGIVAPHVFNQVYEYPLAILLCLLVLPASKNAKVRWVPIVLIIFGLMSLCLLHFTGNSWYQWVALIGLGLIVSVNQSNLHLFISMFMLFGLIFLPVFQQNQILLQERNFYGVKQVTSYKGAHVLISQSTIHGLQFKNEKGHNRGLQSYYGAIQDVVESMKEQYKSLSVTSIGLGTGTVLCQFRAIDQVDVIEIDPQVIEIAKNPELFSYLQDCPPRVDIFKNDGRIALTKSADLSRHILILDAFNSDSIPTHLMTIEAFSLYKQKIRPDGIILVNLSNRHLKLLPLVNAAGHLLGLQVFSKLNQGDLKSGQFSSSWALLTSNHAIISKLKLSAWQSTNKQKRFLWTDDYSNIIPLLRW